MKFTVPRPSRAPVYALSKRIRRQPTAFAVSSFSSGVLLTENGPLMDFMDSTSTINGRLQPIDIVHPCFSGEFSARTAASAALFVFILTSVTEPTKKNREK